MAELISAPTRIPVPGGKVIDEYVGRVTTGSEAVSVAHMIAPGGWVEPAQAPDFDEITVVLRGVVRVEVSDGSGSADTIEVPAGQALITRAGERIRYSTGEAETEYVAVCLPAFSPDTVNRVKETGTTDGAGFAPTPEQVLRAPKVLLHDHLDGGLRPQTIIDLASGAGHGLPATEAAALRQWFEDSANSGSLERYLETFAHTVAVMQTADNIRRVARECVEDLADDGVVYAEVRYAPEQHLAGGLTLNQVVEAVRGGFEAGEGRARANGRPIVVRQLLTAMRHQARSREIAELAVRHREQGVLGFDIAGAEAGFPPTRHLDAFEYLQRENAHFTIHAGEGFGLPSIWQALQWCGADRLGHGVRIIDDITVSDDGSPKLGLLASYIRDKRIPLEMCPSSNIQTGAAKSIAEHPIGLLTKLRFRVTVNTDNRLMSGTSMTGEMLALVEAFGYGLDDLRWFTINAMKSAFLPFDKRLAIIDEIIKPGYAAISRNAGPPRP